jgi:hypothetical protein
MRIAAHRLSTIIREMITKGRKALVLLILIAIAIFILREYHSSQEGPVKHDGANSAKQRYLETYTQWQKAIAEMGELDGRFFDTNFWLPLRTPVEELFRIGANATPFIVEQMRAETNTWTLYKQYVLLKRIGKINLNLIHGSNEVGRETRLRLRDEFVHQWDSGVFQRPDGRLALARRQVDEDNPIENVDITRLFPFFYHGIYALPYLIRTLKEHNSPELFAAFLSTSGDSDYSEFRKRPLDLFPSHFEKLARIKEWWNRESTKFNQLHPLYENIDREVKAIP